MNETIYTPFFLATGEVFRLLLDLDVTASAPESMGGAADEDDRVNIIIGMTGDVTGEILYRFPMGMTLEMVKIMSGMEIEEVDAFVTSALGEIANIISGNAMTGLSERSLACDILPPRVVVGGGAGLSGDGPIVGIKVNTAIGEVELNMQLTPAPGVRAGQPV